jgi:hypothetical protein
VEAYTDASRSDLDRAESAFSPKITSVLETDLGWGERRFVLVSVDSTVGTFGGVGSSELAILDVPSAKILWREHYEGHNGATFGTVFLPAPGTPIVTVLENEGSLGGMGLTYGVWLRPTLESDGTVQCQRLWRDLVEFSYGGNRTGGSFIGCGQMRNLEQAGDYLYERRTFYGEDLEGVDNSVILEPSATPAARLVELLACSSCPEARGCGIVEIRRTERWTLSRHAREMKRSSFSVERIDHGQSQVFPFNLSQRDVAWGPTKLTTPVSRLEREDRAVASPTGRFIARTSNFPYFVSLILESSSGVPIRSIPLWFRDDFDGHPVAVGWSEDRSRVFAVVDFGLDDRVLLSFSVTRKEDYWEKLLTADQEIWKDGFVLAEPVKPH